MPDDVFADRLLRTVGGDHDQLEFIVMEIDRVPLDLRIATLLLRGGRRLDRLNAIGRGRRPAMRRRLQNAFVPWTGGASSLAHG